MSEIITGRATHGLLANDWGCLATVVLDISSLSIARNFDQRLLAYQILITQYVIIVFSVLIFPRMRFSSLIAAATFFLVSSSQAINILLNNDDGFGSGNLRELYRLLKKAGHNGSSQTDISFILGQFILTSIAL